MSIVSGSPRRVQFRASEAHYQSMLLGAMGLVAIVGLAGTRAAALLMIAAALCFTAYGAGVGLGWLGRRQQSYVVTGAAAYLRFLSQFFILVVFSTPLQYVAARANFPLADGALKAADALLGFDWHAYSRWVESQPSLQRTLQLAYDSPLLQIMILGGLFCMFPARNRGAEFIWCFALSLLLVVALSIPFPALGYPGKIGQAHIDALIAARHGTFAAVDGIITFPSFHAAMAVLFTYSARAMKPILGIALPLNVLLLLSTPPMGGHYLVDVFAGITVAVISIALVRWGRYKTKRA